MIYKKLIKNIEQRGIYKPQIADKVVVSDEVNKQLSQLPTIDNIVFKSGLWYPFKDKTTFENEVKTPYNLVEGVDYEVYNNQLLTDISGDLYVDNDLDKNHLFSPKWYINSGVLIGDGFVISSSGNGSQSGIKDTAAKTPANLSLKSNLDNITKTYNNFYFVFFRKDIIKKSIISNGDITNLKFITPLNKVDNNVSFDNTLIEKWNNYESEINTINQKNQEQDSIIATKLDKSIYDSDKPTFATKNELENYASKTYVDSSIANIGSGNKFYEGEIKMFNLKTKADLFIQKHNLKLNIDYQLIQSGKYILTGDNGNVGGSNLIKQSDLPNLTGKVAIINNGTRGLADGVFSLKEWTEEYSAQVYKSPGFFSDFLEFNLNKNTQTQFKPEYIEVYMIVFLRDIEV